MPHRIVVLVVCDGLRPDFVDPATTPTPAQQPKESAAPGCGWSATPWSSQRRRSAELTCPQAMSSCRADAGLCWKNTCQRPPAKWMPLGSFSHPRAGRGWRRGKLRSGWDATEDMTAFQRRWKVKAGAENQQAGTGP